MIVISYGYNYRNAPDHKISPLDGINSYGNRHALSDSLHKWRFHSIGFRPSDLILIFTASIAVHILFSKN
jgi:hypothetical protein